MNIENEKGNRMEILKKEKNPCMIIDRPFTDAELAKLIQSVENEGLIKAPERLKENVLNKSKKISVQMAQKTTTMSVNIQLLLYGLKVSAAVIGAIFLFGVINLNQSVNTASHIPDFSYEAVKNNVAENRDRSDELSSKLNEKSNELTNKLSNISSDIVNWR